MDKNLVFTWIGFVGKETDAILRSRKIPSFTRSYG